MTESLLSKEICNFFLLLCFKFFLFFSKTFSFLSFSCFGSSSTLHLLADLLNEFLIFVPFFVFQAKSFILYNKVVKCYGYIMLFLCCQVILNRQLNNNETESNLHLNIRINNMEVDGY